MAMYRCAACGSDKVIVGTVKDGYSFKKGVLGVAVFGAVGAVAGLDGKKHESYKCMACGMELAQPMDQATKMAIDDCVNYVEMRQMHNWSMLKYRYPNIESGNADKAIRNRANSLQAYVSQVIEEEKEKIERFKAMSDEEINAEQARWLEKADAVHEIFLERNRKAIREWEDGLEDRVAAVKAAHEKAETEATSKVKTAEQERDQLKIELAGIKGLFTGKKKAALQEAISKKEEEIAALQKKCAELPVLLEENLKKAQEDGCPRKLEEDDNLSNEILLEFGLEPSPRWFKDQNDRTSLADYIHRIGIRNIYLMNLVYRIIEGYGRIREKEYKDVIRTQLEAAGKARDIPYDASTLSTALGQLTRLTKGMKRPLQQEFEKISLDDSDYDNQLAGHFKNRIYYQVKN